MRKVPAFFLACLLIPLASCSVQKDGKGKELDSAEIPVELEEDRLTEDELKEKALEEFLDSLSEGERMSLIFLVNIEGNSAYHSVEKYQEDFLVPGGCLFFSFNIADSGEEIVSFIDSIYAWCEKNKIRSLPYVALDQEGGYVNRLRNVTSPLPSAKRIAQSLTPSQGALLYQSQARQMRLLGFTMNLAPVVEVETEDNADFLDTRSYGSAEQVELFAAQAVRAYEENGVASVLKHFPGNTNTDPHTGLPEISLSYEKVYGQLIEPFGSVIKSSSPSAVLMSHARVSSLDKNTPACLSRIWVNDILCNALGFDGLVLSDDIFMAALEKNGFSPETASLAAINAGVDVIMLSEKKFSSVAHFLLDRSKIDSDFAERLRSAQKKVLRYKIGAGLLSTVQNEDGSFTVIPSSSYSEESLEQTRQFRLEEFYRERENGESLYRQFFVGASE